MRMGPGFGYFGGFGMGSGSLMVIKTQSEY